MAMLSAGFFIGVLGYCRPGATASGAHTGAEQMIGSTGEVVQLGGEDEGRVGLHGEIWAARSSRRLAKGQKVRVVSRTGLTLSVEQST